MHWIQAAAGVAGAVAGWRWLVRPIRRFGREALALLKQIRAASTGVTQIAREVEALAGAVVHLVIAVLDDQRTLRREHDELRQQTTELTTMVIDLNADVRRLQKNRRPPE